jgi:hypothetical protein
MFDFTTRSLRRFIRGALFLGSACGLLAVFGCGDDGLGRRYRVSGTVTYKGQPVPKGSISFYPSGGGTETRGAAGVITDGKYTMSTQGENDGVFPGDYLVAITARDVDMSTAQEHVAKHGGSARQDDVSKAYATAKSLIPKKYEVPEQSKLTAKVEAKSNTFDFPLTDD